MEYNPYEPSILGQEWVPIRETDGGDITYLPTGVLEVGNSFYLPQTRTAQDVRVYSKNPKPGYTMVNIYPEDDIRSAGPVRSVLIPVNNSSMTGVNFGFQGGANAADCLLTVNDGKFVKIPLAVNTTPTTGYFRAYFATNDYSALLNGKRILQVNVLAAQNTNFEDQVNRFTQSTNSFFTMAIELSQNNGFNTAPVIAQATADWTNPGVIRNILYDYTVNTNLVDIVKVFRMPTGNVTFKGVAPTLTPWTYAELQRFEISASDRLAVEFYWSTDRGDSTAVSSNVTNEIHYLALEVIYCEETRVAAGVLFTSTTPPEIMTVPLFSLPSKVANPPLPGGGYVMTVGSASPSDTTMLAVRYEPWQVKGLRELYPLPSFNSYEISIPNPLDNTVDGKTFDVTTRTVVPQMTLHTTGGGVVVPEVHPYGNQAVAQVYQTITALQTILDSGQGQTRSYPWARFYARRFGEASAPLKLDSPVSFPTASAELTSQAFDALPGIVDGWKEITLPITNPPTMGGGTNPQWRLSSATTEAENRWEVLGAAAPAISATPGNLLNLAPSFALLGPATYGTPVSGSQVNLSWMPGISPLVSATTADPMSDAAILFSTNPETPPSFAVSPTSMALATNAQNCPVPAAAACIPSSLYFNALSWQPISGAAYDDFTRVSASGWGNTTLGQAWSIGVGSASEFTVTGTEGKINHPSGATATKLAFTNARSSDVDLQVDFRTDTIASAGALAVGLVFRYTDINNMYRAVIDINASQLMDISIYRTVGGTTTILQTRSTPFLHRGGITYTLKARASGNNLYAKVWEKTDPEPPYWQVQIPDSTFLTQTHVGVRTANGSSMVADYPFYFDNFKVAPSDFGAYEIQRYDPVDNQFSTIMLCSNPAVTGFSDFEARVGQQSVYRARTRNVYDFAGLFSPQVTGAVPSPGVVGASVSLLLFTSNYRQDGSLNLAYSAEWEGTPTEQFRWTEADQVTLQMMYGKDFPTAFHALERGGEAFSRAILVSATGVPLVTKANGFEDLRNMAWASAPYICVRDELGNRWYSLVTVPEGSRRRMVNKGHLLVSTVNVVEVTSTPFPVDP